MKSSIVVLLVAVAAISIATQKRLAEAQKQLDELRTEMLATPALAKNISEVCPAHQITMVPKEVPVVYGFLASIGPYPEAKTVAREFPFAQDWIAGGCCISSESPKTRRAFVCQKCTEAEKAWIKADTK
jgi:hypothetical protein